MTTALTVSAISTNSSTPSTAKKLISATGGAKGSGITTKIGTSTGGGQIWSQGNTGAWPALGSIGSPDGHGFVFDVNTLDNLDIFTGNYVFTFNFQLSSGATCSATITYRAYIYDGTNYTAICSGVSTSKSLSGLAATSVPVTVSSVTAASFTPGQFLYIDIWPHITLATTSSTATIEYFTSSTTSAGWSGCSLQTPGFGPPITTNTYSAPAEICVPPETLLRCLDSLRQVSQ